MADVYSVSETETRKVWIDGKKIYRRVFDVGAKAVGQYGFSTGLTNVATVTDIRGIGLNGSNWYPIPYPYDSSHLGWVYSTGAYTTYKIPFDSSKTYIIMEYTKP